MCIIAGDLAGAAHQEPVMETSDRKRTRKKKQTQAHAPRSAEDLAYEEQAWEVFLRFSEDTEPTVADSTEGPAFQGDHTEKADSSEGS
jgi:hypothetical protein